jgi:hypothetical protein
MKIIERIHEYLYHKRLKPIPFEKKVGLSNGYLGKQLRRKADVGESVLVKIIEHCPDLNPIWLVSGKGEMLKGLNVPLPNSNIESEKIIEMEKAMAEKDAEIATLKDELLIIYRKMSGAKSNKSPTNFYGSSAKAALLTGLVNE